MTFSNILCMSMTLVSLTSRMASGNPGEALGDSQEGNAYGYPIGDPRRCIQQARQTNMDMTRFGVLPGAGWDNLRNLDMGMVVWYNYSQCKITDDGRFLLPDSVTAFPIKSSHVETFAELITSYLETTSTTARSINLQASLTTLKVTASGSYSEDHELIKSKQIEDNTVTTRVQLRYHRYQARLKPDPPLDPQFKSRILTIAGNLLLNQTEKAIYLGQLLVRDYGTHVQTGVVAGAGLEKKDFLKKHFVTNGQTEKTNILAEASASFFDVFKASSTYKHSTSTSTSNKYSQSVTNSYVTSHGGTYLSGDTSLDTWVKSVDSNLVAMDRTGDPLNFMVTQALFPEIPVTVLAQLYQIVQQSVEMYYEMNSLPGCTASASANFNPAANLDDGTCSERPTNFTFGGVFQTCRITSGSSAYTNPCRNLIQTNPSTGAASCPDGYKAVKILSASKSSPLEFRKKCHRCWIFAKCCKTRQYQAHAVYHTFWCAATGAVAQYSGYMFGGVYTSSNKNPITGGHNCPDNFYGLRILSDMTVCLSDEYSRASGLPFGGFFTCKTGNPLAVAGVLLDKTHDIVDPSKIHLLRDFVMSDDAQPGDHRPRGCPKGYSQHMATVEQGCAIHYCIKSGSLKGPNAPPVKRPPFSVLPPALLEEEESLVMFDLASQTWHKDLDAEHTLSEVSPMATLLHDPVAASREDEEYGLTTGSIAGIAVAVAVVVVAIAIAVIVIKRRRKRAESQNLLKQRRKPPPTPQSQV